MPRRSGSTTGAVPSNEGSRGADDSPSDEGSTTGAKGLQEKQGGGRHAGPPAGEAQPEQQTRVPVTWQGRRVAELAVGAAPEEDRSSLERAAVLISDHCLVGWDTGGEAWAPERRSTAAAPLVSSTSGGRSSCAPLPCITL